MIVWVRKLKPARFANRDVCFCAVTRFDVRMDSIEPVRDLIARGERGRWAAERAATLLRCCAPSLFAQVPRPHAWFVLFDRAVSPVVSRLLDGLLDGEYVVPLFLGDDWQRALPGELSLVVRDRFPWARYVAQTRVDSDDSLHRSFHYVVDRALADLRADGRFAGRVLLNLPFGAAGDEGGLTARFLESSFFSLVEPVGDGMVGPYATNHTKMGRHAPVVQVMTERPMWLYRRHGANLSRGAIPRTWPAFAERDEILAELGLGGEGGHGSNDSTK